jgi:hypothetical protein
VAGIVSMPPASQGVPALCLRRLARVLAAAPASESGRAMVRQLAAALGRDAEEMQAYGLKREALRSGLVTDEEAGAYQGALLRLAGQPALVRSGGLGMGPVAPSLRLK